MAQNSEIKIPTTVPVRTDHISYARGYQDANEDCAPSTETMYLGHPVSYWSEMALTFLPLLLLLGFLILYARRQNRQVKLSLDRQAKALDSQQEALNLVRQGQRLQEEGMELARRQNQLLTEISQKLDRTQ